MEQRGALRHVTPKDSVRLRYSARKLNPQRTPFNIGRLSLHEFKRGVKNTEDLDVLQSLLKKTWNAFSVSPLFTWSNRQTKLKRYSRRVVTHLAESLPVDDGDSYDVVYELKQDLKFNTTDDSAVKISVCMLEGGNPKQVFVGYMLSWGCPKTAKPADLDDVLYLPVLLCAGPKRLTTQVCRALESIHDCVISPVDLVEFERKDMWFALLSYLQIEGETIAISYKIPNRPTVGSIEVTMSSDVTTELSNLIHKKDGRTITDESISLFWTEISDYIADIYEMNLQKCEMVKLQTSKAVLTSNKFRASSPKAMHAILLFLTNRSTILEADTS